MTGQLQALRAAVDAGKLDASSTRFALSLLSKRSLSASQLYWVGELIKRADRPAPAAPVAEQLAASVVGIFQMFARAKARGLKWPKIHLTAEDGTPVQFAVAGSASKYTGQVMVTDGGRFGANRYFGRISEAGELVTGRDITAQVRALVERFAADPATVAAEYGHHTGHCCFCALKLTTDESVTVGYGPVCADKFGLAWGKRAAAAVRAEQVA
jgi:hypothetical protein